MKWISIHTFLQYYCNAKLHSLYTNACFCSLFNYTNHKIINIQTQLSYSVLNLVHGDELLHPYELSTFTVDIILRVGLLPCIPLLHYRWIWLIHAVILHQYRAFLLYTHTYKMQLILIQLLAMIFEIILTMLPLVTSTLLVSHTYPAIPLNNPGFT